MQCVTFLKYYILTSFTFLDEAFSPEITKNLTVSRLFFKFWARVGTHRRNIWLYLVLDLTLLGLVWLYSVVFYLIWLDLIVFGCLLLFLSVSDCINVSDGEDRNPPKKYVIGVCCLWFYFMLYVIVCCCMLYIVADMWVMVRVEGSIREIYAYRPVRIFMQKANKTSLTDVAAIDGLVRGDLVIAWLGEMSMDI